MEGIGLGVASIRKLRLATGKSWRSDSSSRIAVELVFYTGSCNAGEEVDALRVESAHLGSPGTSRVDLTTDSSTEFLRTTADFFTDA